MHWRSRTADESVTSASWYATQLTDLSSYTATCSPISAQTRAASNGGRSSRINIDRTRADTMNEGRRMAWRPQTHAME